MLWIVPLMGNLQLLLAGKVQSLKNSVLYFIRGEFRYYCTNAYHADSSTNLFVILSSLSPYFSQEFDNWLAPGLFCNLWECRKASLQELCNPIVCATPVRITGNPIFSDHSRCQERYTRFPTGNCGCRRCSLIIPTWGLCLVLPVPLVWGRTLWESQGTSETSGFDQAKTPHFNNSPGLCHPLLPWLCVLYQGPLKCQRIDHCSSQTPNFHPAKNSTWPGSTLLVITFLCDWETGAELQTCLRAGRKTGKPTS